MDDVCVPLQDLRHLRWDERAVTSGTSGTFPKARRSGHGVTYYYKLSCYDSYRGIYGHECVNEVLAARLLAELKIPRVDYRLVHARVAIDGEERETWLNVSTSFRAPGERKMTFELFYDLKRHSGESPFAFCQRMGWGRHIAQMLAFDFLIANRDRHGANIEVILSPDGAMRLAPLFDNGLSFVFSCYGDAKRAAAFDALEDVNANNYLGTRSLLENLQFVTDLAEGSLALPVLDAAALDRVFDQLDPAIPSAAHRAKMREMIERRWHLLVERGIVVPQGAGAGAGEDVR
ncbi:hypothetical protein AALA69_04605 [Eggerthellaceae bacterium 24-137]